jgi:DNA-binding transcriptional ArsR family regulator
VSATVIELESMNANAAEATAIKLDSMQASAAKAAAVLRALAHEGRLLLLCQLSQGEHGVGELEALLGIRQPSLSQQLGVLRRQGLIAARREGRQVRYRIADDKVLALLQRLYELYCDI